MCILSLIIKQNKCKGNKSIMIIKLYKKAIFLYKKIILTILHWLNYNKIENEEGSCHVIVNTVDLLLAIVYAFISIHNLKSVSSIICVLNLITLGRYILDNIKQTSHLYEKHCNKYFEKINFENKLFYNRKLIIELLILTIITLSLTPYWVSGILFEDYVIRRFAKAIIWLNLVESFIKINAELFEASVDV